MVTEATVEIPTAHKKWLTSGPAARIMGVSPLTVHRRAKAGLIRSQLKAGGPHYLFHPDDVEKFRQKD